MVSARPAVAGGEDGFFREYAVGWHSGWDVRNASENWRTFCKVYSDAYYRWLAPALAGSWVRYPLGFVWSFTMRWWSMLWPHEFGHWMRTEGAGGEFRFVRFAFPGIIGRLTLPHSATAEDHLLALIGGFEANHLTAMMVREEFHRRDGLWNDELGLAFGHRIMVPLYALVFAPQDPGRAATWTNAGGDPTTFAKLVWERKGWPLLGADGGPDRRLVRFYNGMVAASLLWTLLDPGFYEEVSAFFGDELKGRRPWGVDVGGVRWSYATLFNTSVLGPELVVGPSCEGGWKDVRRPYALWLAVPECRWRRLGLRSSGGPWRRGGCASGFLGPGDLRHGADGPCGGGVDVRGSVGGEGGVWLQGGGVCVGP